MYEQLGLGLVEGDVLPFKKSSKRRKKRVEFSKNNKDFDFHDLSNVVVGQFNEEALNYLVEFLDSSKFSLPSLYLHGRKGVGKTKLIFGAIGEYLRKNPFYNCKMFSGKDFVEERNAACEVSRKSEFLDDCQSVDVLIIDDVEEVSASPEIIADLLYVSERVSERGGKVIFTSKYSLSALKRHSDHLVNSIDYFGVQKIDCFDNASSVSIFKKVSSELGISLEDEIIDCLDYSGVKAGPDVNRLIREIFRIKISESLETLNIDSLSKYGVIKVAEKIDEEIEELLVTFADEFHVNLRDIRSRSRKAHIVIDRHIVMHYLNHVKGISLNRIAGHFGRDHTVALYGVRKIEAELASVSCGKFFSRLKDYKDFL